MLHRLKSGALDSLFRAAAVFLASAGVSLCVCGALFPMTDRRLVLLICLGTALLFALARSLTALWGLLFLPAVGLLALGAAGGGPLAQAFGGLRSLLYYPGQTQSLLLLYRPALTAVISLLAALFCTGAAFGDAPFLLGIFCFGALTPVYLKHPDTSLSYAALCAAALLMLLSARQKAQGKRAGALLVTAALVTAAAFLTPSAVRQSEPLRQAAQTAYDTMEAYLPANDSVLRSGYSLQSDGYLPLADSFNERLGGEAQPHQAPVMEVWTDRTVYLRANTKNAYTGASWQDTLSDRRYLYADVFSAARREKTLNSFIPDGAGDEKPLRVRVRLLRNGPTTLFAPDRTLSLSPDSTDMVPYYNDSSELFLSRELRAGDSYQLTYLPVSADRSRTAVWALNGSAREDPYEEEIRAAYLSVPDFVRLNPAVEELGFQAAGGEEDPFYRALSIRNWLRDRYPYTLDAASPPPNTDFVSWFLLTEKQGYCTYFATAMTVLCRLQGIPARFVAGYLVRPDDTGYALVTGENGHAWTEVYLHGFGWLTLDATPGPEEFLPGDDGDSLPGREDEPEEDEPEEDEGPETTPVPEDFGDEDDLPPETPVPGPDEAEKEPGPDDVPPEEEPEETPEERPADLTLALLLAGGVLFLLLTAFLVRLYMTEPVRRAKRQPDRGAAILYTAMETALEIAGLPRKPDETLDEYADRVQPRCPSVPLRAAFTAYSADVYGEHRLQLGPFIGAWKALRKALAPIDRFRVRVRLLRG